jgi:hypothetical protein
VPYKFLQNEKRKDPLLVMVASKLNFVQSFEGRGQQVGRWGVLESQSSMWEAKALFILAVRVSGGDEVFFKMQFVSVSPYMITTKKDSSSVFSMPRNLVGYNKS